MLIVEGDGSALAVRHAVAKAGRFAGPHKGLKSEFRYVAIDARGRDLVTIPIDLSVFQTSPKKGAKPVVVNGCEVRTTRVSTLLNVPRTAGAVRYEIRRGKVVIGKLSQAELQKLLRGGR